jgi:hypothetical protein
MGYSEGVILSSSFAAIFQIDYQVYFTDEPKFPIPILQPNNSYKLFWRK